MTHFMPLTIFARCSLDSFRYDWARFKLLATVISISSTHPATGMTSGKISTGDSAYIIPITAQIHAPTCDSFFSSKSSDIALSPFFHFFPNTFVSGLIKQIAKRQNRVWHRPDASAMRTWLWHRKYRCMIFIVWCLKCLPALCAFESFCSSIHNF